MNSEYLSIEDARKLKEYDEMSKILHRYIEECEKQNKIIKELEKKIEELEKGIK